MTSSSDVITRHSSHPPAGDRWSNKVTSKHECPAPHRLRCSPTQRRRRRRVHATRTSRNTKYTIRARAPAVRVTRRDGNDDCDTRATTGVCAPMAIFPSAPCSERYSQLALASGAGGATPSPAPPRTLSSQGGGARRGHRRAGATTGQPAAHAVVGRPGASLTPV